MKIIRASQEQKLCKPLTKCNFTKVFTPDGGLSDTIRLMLLDVKPRN